MEVMEDGNLMDKVNILIQRDMEYYKSKQSVLQETICPGIIGGRLDFPRSASFAAVKLVMWWEDEYVAAYRKPSGFFQKHVLSSRDSTDANRGCGGIVRTSDPSKFISSISKSADQLMEHLHVLTQEALDHADLSVLTGTIGAAALLKNCLWFFIQILSELKTFSIEALQIGYKKYHEMCEALAERLLDLHCRLVSLYILQDADCLDWENIRPFFESERGSYTIQMWWLYMQGTREDLWNTVPPKMAQRVFSGMLNESLTILTVRYTQSSPSEARSELLLVDISNLLLCIAQLLPSICHSVEDFIGTSLNNNNSKILRDIHAKCQELFCCFLLRGASLEILYRIFKKDLNDVELFKSKSTSPSPWIIFALSNIFKDCEMNFDKIDNLDENCCLGLQLMVLLAQPQPDWALLLKVLCNNSFKVLRVLLTTFLDCFNVEMKRSCQKPVDCDNFLCPVDGSCKNVDTTSLTLNACHYYDLIVSATEVLLYVGNDEEYKLVLINNVTRCPDWFKCFERKQVWNQIRFPWYEALLSQATPVLDFVVETTINALQTGATMYQAMSLIIACLSQYWDVINDCLPRIAYLFQEAIPTEVNPVGNSVLMQILTSALYTSLIGISENKSVKKGVSFQGSLKDNENKADDTTSMKESREGCDPTDSVALAAAEALCSIDTASNVYFILNIVLNEKAVSPFLKKNRRDEDNMHTDQIEEFLDQVSSSKDDLSFFTKHGSKRIENNQEMTEMLVSDLLMTTEGKKSLKTLFHFIKHNSCWLYTKLGVNECVDINPPNKVLSPSQPLLQKMFHIGCSPFDQLLTKQLNPNWHALLQTPLGLSSEKVWMQICLRWEFKDTSSSQLSAHDAHIVHNLTSILKQ